MQNNRAQIGDKVKSRVTGFTGIVTDRAEHLAGCDRLWIEPPVDSDGKQPDGEWIDIDLVEVVEAAVIARVNHTH